MWGHGNEQTRGGGNPSQKETIMARNKVHPAEKNDGSGDPNLDEIRVRKRVDFGSKNGRNGTFKPDACYSDWDTTTARNKVDPTEKHERNGAANPDAGNSSNWGIDRKSDNPVCNGDCSGQNSVQESRKKITRSIGARFLPGRNLPRNAWGPQREGESDGTPPLGQQNAIDQADVTTPAGILALLGRARHSLVAGGLRGAFRLLKGFREADRQGGGRVTLSGFKTVVGEAGLGLKEAEMRILFQVGKNKLDHLLLQNCVHFFGDGVTRQLCRTMSVRVDRNGITRQVKPVER